METDFYTWYAFGEELRRVGNRYYPLLELWHKAGRDRDNYQKLAYSHFVYVGDKSPLYFNFKLAAREFAVGGADGVAAALWDRMDRELHRPREVRVGEHPEFAHCVSLFNLFVESALSRLGVRDSAVHRRAVGAMYLSYLAVQLAGAVAEVETFERLVAVFGADRVRWAGDDEEHTDVDLYFDGLPISVKNYHAFGKYTFNKYRNKSVKPVMFLDRNFEWAVPKSDVPCRVTDGGFKMWDYEFGKRADFLSVVERLGGLPVDRGFVPDFGCLGSSPIDDCLSVPRRSIYKVGSTEYVATMPTPDDELFARAML